MTRELFSQHWWLDAIAPGGWGEAVASRNGRMAATLPYVVGRERFGLVRIGTTSLAPRLGPRFDLPDSKSMTRMGRESDLIAEMVAQLPKYDYLSFSMPSRVTNWLPFHRLGFRQTTRYSYVIDPRSADELWRGFSEATRRAIRKAEATVSLSDGDPLTLWRLASSSFGRQNRRNPYRRESLRAASSAAVTRSSGAIRTATDGDGRAHAAAMFVWDDERLYYLVGGADTALRSSGAMSLIMWDGIRMAQAMGRRFDFEGSMIPSVEKFFRGFGGRLEPYSHITDTGRRLSVALAVRDIGLAVRRRRR